MDHTYIVVSGTLYLKFSDRTEVISEQQYLTLVHINEPVLFYGNENCHVFYIGSNNKQGDAQQQCQNYQPDQ